MADTGAPWNIPYVEPSDLVRNYPAAAEDLADAIAAGLTAAGNPGIGSNVVQTVKTDVFTTSATTPADVTGLAVTITPSSDTSRVLVIAQVMFSISANDNNQSGHMLLVGGNLNYIGDASGSRTRSSGYSGLVSSFNVDRAIVPHTLVVVDSPATAAAVTYKIQTFRTSALTTVVNRIGFDDNNVNRAVLASSITAIEVAA